MPLLVVFIASILQTVGINVSLYSFQEKMGNNVGVFSIYSEAIQDEIICS